MSDSTDLRIIKTKNKLRAAFAKMMRETSFDHLSINDLCAKAKIRRATFYRHFGDKYDFLETTVTSILTELVARVGSVSQKKDPIDYYCTYIREVINYCNNNADMIKNILNSSAYRTVLNVVLEGTLASFRHDLAINEASGVKLPVDVETLAQFLNGGIAHVMLMWLTHPEITGDSIVASARILFKKLLEG